MLWGRGEERRSPNLILGLTLSASTALSDSVPYWWLCCGGKEQRAMYQFETIFGLDSWRGTGVSSEVAEDDMMMRRAPDVCQVHID